MFAMRDLAIAGHGRPGRAKGRWPLIAAGAALILLLIFSTSAVFVQASWPVESFQIGVFAFTATYLLCGVRGDSENLADGVAPWLVYFIPAWGVVQILAHTTASTMETREAVLRWGALAAVFFLSQMVARTRAAREIMLVTFLCFSTVMAVLCLTQLFTSAGRVLWIFSTGYPDVYATFPNHNNYAQFIEVSLPIALWRAMYDGRRSWGYALIGGVLYASVIGAASRAGAILCTAELLAMLAIGVIQHRHQNLGRLFHSSAAALVMVPLLAAIFTSVVGWHRIWERFQQNNPHEGRLEYMLSAVDMARHRPLMGYGLGTFPEVYQQHAIEDFPFYVNHAHNDWAEFAADGGIPFLLLVFIPFAAAVPVAIKHPWGLGLAAVMLHACVDYPFPRPAVSGWMFAMLGLLYMARNSDRRQKGVATPPDPDHSPQEVEFKRRKLQLGRA
ncbi:MAG TPA: O-antigen ligase family protein [Terracidiphilus sp.]|nr:O-antigen ligase family protein [Terracidiphilus sp.]